jgi:ABC-2 type transport system permease protein
MTTVRRVVGSEIIKLRTLRANIWLLAVAAAAVVLLGPIQAVGQVVAPSEDADDPMSIALTGVSLATLLAGVLGVLSVTGEYAPRAIRTTFTLVPRRGHVVVAKTLALTLATTLAGAVSVAAAVTASLAILGSPYPHMVQVSAATVWYLVGWGILGQAAGWATRSKIGGAALLIGVMMLLPPLLALVPGRAGELLPAVMPSSAGSAMIGTEHAVAGFLLWTAYLAGFTALSAWLVSRRDA